MKSRVVIRASLACAIASEVSATLALRAAVDGYWWYVLVVPGYVISFVLLAVVLRKGLSIAVAYGIWSACGVAATAVGSMVLFGDRLTWIAVAGFVSVVAGVVLIESGSHDDAPVERAGPR
jgi:small multidrug resistance pump